MTASRAAHCIVACAEVFRGDGEILASPIGTTPSIGARLARATFEPDLLMSDGVASLVANVSPFGVPARDVVEGQVGMVVEGLHAAPALAALAREAGVDLPITDAVCSVVTGTPIPTAIATLLARAAPAGEF